MTEHSYYHWKHEPVVTYKRLSTDCSLARYVLKRADRYDKETVELAVQLIKEGKEVSKDDTRRD